MGVGGTRAINKKKISESDETSRAEELTPVCDELKKPEI
jgi:hypothetical protein